MQRAFLFCSMSILMGASLAAQDQAELDAIPQIDDEPSCWFHETAIGGYASNIASNRAADSRDNTIRKSQDTMSYLGILDGKLVYNDDYNIVEQRLQLNFGRQKQEDADWAENADLIDYDGVYKRPKLKQPHYVYDAWGVDSLFTGKPPEEAPLDPLTGKVSVGYGQKRSLTAHRSFDWRIGTRAQKTWGRGLGADARALETGIEFFARYEGKPSKELTYYAQVESFSEFEDPGHLRNLLQARVTYQMHKFVALEVSLRAYLETRPDDAPVDASGYNELSFRQETILGIVCRF